jgi:peptidoglycan/LPS O-acetylase OafA/YrhL
MMEKKPEISALTGLRGVAALSVIVSHYASWRAPYHFNTVPWFIERLFGTAGFGMSLFFTLSGFVIAYNYVDLDWGKRAIASLGHFAWLRFSRLYPAFMLFVVIVAVSQYGGGTLGNAFWPVTLLVTSSAQSFFPFQFNGTMIYDLSYNVSWSISTEAAFYLFFALSMILLRKCTLRFGPIGSHAWIACGLLYLGAIAFLNVHSAATVHILSSAFPANLTNDELDHWFFYFSPFTRFYDFVFGCMAAAAVKRGVDLRNFSLPAIVVLIWSTWFAVSLDWHTFQILQPPLLCIVMASPSQATLTGRTLSTCGLVSIGKISYSLYLFQTLVSFIPLSQTAVFTWPLFCQFMGYLAISLLTLGCFAMGVYVCIERPAQRWLRRLLDYFERPSRPAIPFTIAGDAA